MSLSIISLPTDNFERMKIHRKNMIRHMTKKKIEILGDDDYGDIEREDFK